MAQQKKTGTKTGAGASKARAPRTSKPRSRAKSRVKAAVSAEEREKAREAALLNVSGSREDDPKAAARNEAPRTGEDRKQSRETRANEKSPNKQTEISNKKGTDSIMADAKTETKQTQEELKSQVENMNEQATAYAREFSQKAQDAAGEMSELAKENMEALVESGKIATKGSAEIAKDNVAFAKKSMEDFAATAKELSNTRNPSDFVQIQSEYVRKSFDANMAQFSKSTEAFMKLMGDAYQPVANRMSVTAEKLKAA